MSAPQTHDPLTVTLKDNSVWRRRAVTDAGLGLYAVEGSCQCPEYLLVSLAELAVHGIQGMAHALPMPVGPVPRTLDVVEDELTGVSLSLYEEELTTERLRWALASAKRGRARLRAQVAELNESVTTAAEALRAKEAPAGPYPPVMRWASLLDREDLADFLDELAASAIANASSDVALAEVETTCRTWRLIAEAQHGHNTAPGPDAVTQAFAPMAAPREDVSRQVEKLRNLLAGQRAVVEDPHDGPLAHRYRLSHDLPGLGGAS